MTLRTFRTKKLDRGCREAAEKSSNSQSIKLDKKTQEQNMDSDKKSVQTKKMIVSWKLWKRSKRWPETVEKTQKHKENNR